MRGINSEILDALVILDEVAEQCEKSAQWIREAGCPYESDEEIFAYVQGMALSNSAIHKIRKKIRHLREELLQHDPDSPPKKFC